MIVGVRLAQRERSHKDSYRTATIGEGRVPAIATAFDAGYANPARKPGYIDLTFSHAKAHVFRDAVAHLLSPEMTVHQTGKSAAIRIATQGFDVNESLEEGMPKVRAAFEASERLIALYREERTALDDAAEISMA